jgi:hypothetical protein
VRILIASSSTRLARILVQQTRQIMETDWFKSLFPNCQIKKTGNNGQIFSTTQNGFRMGVSRGENIIGYGADYLIMDDPEDPIKITSKAYRDKTFEWFQSVFASRANDRQKSRMVLCTARMHPDDLTQKLLNQNEKIKEFFDGNSSFDSNYGGGAHDHLIDGDEAQNEDESLGRNVDQNAKDHFDKKNFSFEKILANELNKFSEVNLSQRDQNLEFSKYFDGMMSQFDGCCPPSRIKSSSPGGATGLKSLRLNSLLERLSSDSGVRFGSEFLEPDSTLDSFSDSDPWCKSSPSESDEYSKNGPLRYNICRTTSEIDDSSSSESDESSYRRNEGSKFDDLCRPFSDSNSRSGPSFPSRSKVKIEKRITTQDPKKIIRPSQKFLTRIRDLKRDLSLSPSQSEFVCSNKYCEIKFKIEPSSLLFGAQTFRGKTIFLDYINNNCFINLFSKASSSSGSSGRLDSLNLNSGASLSELVTISVSVLASMIISQDGKHSIQSSKQKKSSNNLNHSNPRKLPQKSKEDSNFPIDTHISEQATEADLNPSGLSCHRPNSQAQSSATHHQSKEDSNSPIDTHISEQATEADLNPSGLSCHRPNSQAQSSATHHSNQIAHQLSKAAICQVSPPESWTLAFSKENNSINLDNPDPKDTAIKKFGNKKALEDLNKKTEYKNITPQSDLCDFKDSRISSEFVFDIFSKCNLNIVYSFKNYLKHYYNNYKIKLKIGQDSISKNNQKTRKNDIEFVEIWNELKLPILNERFSFFEYKIGAYEFALKENEILNSMRYSRKMLKFLKISLGDEQFFSQYLQRPINFSASILKKKYVSYYDIFMIKDALLSNSHKIVQSWDTASSCVGPNNFSVCTTWAVIDKRYYLLDVLRVKANYKKLREIFIEHYRKFSDKNFFVKFFDRLSNLIDRNNDASKKIIELT